MGYKSICINCRISFSNGTDFNKPAKEICPQCSGKLILVSQKFKPPKKSDLQGWKIVAFLIENGFNFYSAYEEIGNNLFVRREYPKTLRDAEEFIKSASKLR